MDIMKIGYKPLFGLCMAILGALGGLCASLFLWGLWNSLLNYGLLHTPLRIFFPGAAHWGLAGTLAASLICLCQSKTERWEGVVPNIPSVLGALPMVWFFINMEYSLWKSCWLPWGFCTIMVLGLAVYQISDDLQNTLWNRLKERRK